METVECLNINNKQKKIATLQSQPAINTNSLKRRGPETSLSEVDNSIDLDDSVVSFCGN